MLFRSLHLILGLACVACSAQTTRQPASEPVGKTSITSAAARGTWLSEGSFGWSGVYGTHFWVDPKENLVGILLAQTSSRALLSDFENAVMQALVD